MRLLVWHKKYFCPFCNIYISNVFTFEIITNYNDSHLIPSECAAFAINVCIDIDSYSRFILKADNIPAEMKVKCTIM